MSTNIGPSQVLIIRHGEKVGDPKKDDNRTLTTEDLM